jgi:hypothetical protein
MDAETPSRSLDNMSVGPRDCVAGMPEIASCKLILICLSLLQAGVMKDCSTDDDVMWLVTHRGIPVSHFPDGIHPKSNQPIPK